MKSPLLATLCIAISPLTVSTASAQTVSVPNKVEDRSIDSIPEELKAFMNLDEEERAEFAKLVAKAQGYFREQRVIESLAVISKAQLIFENHPAILNLRGSCYVHLRDFVGAEKQFKRALKITPNSTQILFNIAEMHFVTQRWKSCAQKMTELNELLPESTQNKDIKRLVEFKLLLCYIKLNRTKEAKELAKLYDMWDDSPYYYYANAAISFSADDKIGADQILKRASRVFRRPGDLAGWDDTLTEFGYIKSFYGGGDEG